MKKTIQDILKDIEANLIGKELKGISGSAAIFKITEIDYSNKTLILDVQGTRKTWTFERMSKVWNELYYRPAANVEVVFSGSGSSRNQVETIYASLPYIQWLLIEGKKHIAYVVKETHPYGELMRMSSEEEAQYEKWMKVTNPINPFLDDDEVMELIGSIEIVNDSVRDEYSIEEVGEMLKTMTEKAGANMKMCSIHMFGIKYGKPILNSGIKASKIIAAAGLNQSFATELQTGINIYKALINKVFGIGFTTMDAVSTDVLSNSTAENVLLYGVPGSGKSFFIKENYPCSPDCMERVVFHPDYTYSDFVGQIMPRVEGDKLKYVFVPGPFTKALKAAHDFPTRKHYLIIEEINRGNAPAIFGEIFQLLDRDEKGQSEYGITNFDIALEVYGNAEHKVKIPSNLWILATMNTSDQNVFTLDTAFQRRWTMRHIENKVTKANHANALIEGSTVTWAGFAEVVNEQVIEANKVIGSSADKRLGAYFVKERELYVDRFPEKVLKYLWDDAFKMGHEYIFSDKMTSLDVVIETYSSTSGDRLESVLEESAFKRMQAYSNALSKAAHNKVEKDTMINTQAK